MKTILVIEDDPAIVRGLEDALAAEHYKVISAANGEKGFSLAKGEAVDVILLDLKLPDKNGEEICRDLRKSGVSTPILVLTSKKGEMDKVLLLEVGADDYVTKPFSIRELSARIKALLRRHTEIKKEIEEISFGTIYADFRKQEAMKKGKTLKLSSKEFEILKFFAIHEGLVVTRDMLLNAVWGYETFPTTRTVDNYVLSLRKKFEDNPSKPRHFLTVHTTGYKFVR